MGSQPTGFMGQPQQQQQRQQQPMQTGFGGQQRPMGSNISPLPTGQNQQQPGGGNYSFLNTQPTGFRPSFTGSSGSGMAPQMTGYPGGGASGVLSQPTGFGGGGGMMSQPTGMGMGMGGGGMMSQPTGMGGGMMSQPTGMGGGLMSQPTGMGGLRAQPTGVHDPRLQSMMQSFMPSNTSQASLQVLVLAPRPMLTTSHSLHPECRSSNPPNNPSNNNSNPSSRTHRSRRPKSLGC